MTKRLCDCCGIEFDSEHWKTCDQCREALDLLPEEVKWMIDRTIKHRMARLSVRLQMVEDWIYLNFKNK